MAEKYTRVRAQRNGTRPAYEAWGNGMPHNHPAPAQPQGRTSQDSFFRAAEPDMRLGSTVAAMVVFMVAMQQVRSGNVMGADMSGVATRTNDFALRLLG